MFVHCIWAHALKADAVQLDPGLVTVCPATNLLCLCLLFVVSLRLVTAQVLCLLIGDANTHGLFTDDSPTSNSIHWRDATMVFWRFCLFFQWLVPFLLSEERFEQSLLDIVRVRGRSHAFASKLMLMLELQDQELDKKVCLAFTSFAEHSRLSTPTE